MMLPLLFHYVNINDDDIKTSEFNFLFMKWHTKKDSD